MKRFGSVAYMDKAGVLGTSLWLTGICFLSTVDSYYLDFAYPE